jgi:hypothetical protein
MALDDHRFPYHHHHSHHDDRTSKNHPSKAAQDEAAK